MRKRSHAVEWSSTQLLPLRTGDKSERRVTLKVERKRRSQQAGTETCEKEAENEAPEVKLTAVWQH